MKRSLSQTLFPGGVSQFPGSQPIRFRLLTLHQMFSECGQSVGVMSEADTNISLILTALKTHIVKSFFGPLSTSLWPPGGPNPQIYFEGKLGKCSLDN